MTKGKVTPSPVIDFHISFLTGRRLQSPLKKGLGSMAASFQEMAPAWNDAGTFLSQLDELGIARAILVNYIAPDPLDASEGANEELAAFCAFSPDRLIPAAAIHPRLVAHAAAKMDLLCGDMGIRLIAFHPIHQSVEANAYRGGIQELGVVLRKAQEYRTPVLIATGSSPFEGTRIQYGNPMVCDDIGVDFPKLRVILGQGGYPLWVKEAAFLVQRHRNFYLDITGIQPKELLELFPNLEEISHKVLFGSGWPAPSTGSWKELLKQFRKVKISEEAKSRILATNAERLLAGH